MESKVQQKVQWMHLDEIQEVTEFIWGRTPQGTLPYSKEGLYLYLKTTKHKVYIVRNNNKIDVVAIYHKYKDTLNFICLVVRGGLKTKTFIREGLRDIIKTEKPKRVCWMNTKFDFRTYKITGRESWLSQYHF